MIGVRWALGLCLVLVVGCRTAEPAPAEGGAPIAHSPAETASSPRGADTTSPPLDATASTPSTPPAPSETASPSTSRAGTGGSSTAERLPTPTHDLTPFRGQHVYAGLPVAASGAEYTLLENLGFVVGYSESRKNPLWVAFRLEGGVAHEAGKRPGRFKVDERTQARVSHEDYKQRDYQRDPQAYDRGHMAPNHAIATRYGREAQLETFLMSNICPQRKTLNQQTWAALERTIAGVWAEDCGEVWVVVGPIFGEAPERLNGVSQIPAAFYALVLDEEAGAPRVVAAVMTQEVSGKQPLAPFVTTVDAVEAATALDFFADLPDDLEAWLEASQPDARWGLDHPLGATRPR